MTDIIDKALDSVQDETERTAEGTVNGHDIRLEKKKYQKSQRGPTAWEVAVYVDGEPYASERENDLTANQAEDLFRVLVKKYDLTE